MFTIQVILQLFTSKKSCKVKSKNLQSYSFVKSKELSQKVTHPE